MLVLWHYIKSQAKDTEGR